MEGRRYSFTHPDRSIEVDVFVDRLDFCHVVQVGDRLGEHPFALPIETLLLSNLQVIEPTATDLMDTAAILLSHPVLDGRSGPESMPAAAVAGVLTRDWGFHHTVTRNLDRLAGYAAALDLDEGERTPLAAAVAALHAAIDAAPKTLAWRLRGRIGERMRWWQDVDEQQEAY